MYFYFENQSLITFVKRFKILVMLSVRVITDSEKKKA